MKRFSIIIMVLGLIAGSVSTAGARQGAKRVERTVEGNYGAVPEPFTGCNGDRGSFACVIVDARRREAVFSATVTDAHGQPVFVQVVTEGGGRVGTFCGETSEPLYFDPGSRLEFLIEPAPHFFSNWGLGWVGPLDCPYRMKTSGSISVTLSNLA